MNFILLHSVFYYFLYFSTGRYSVCVMQVKLFCVFFFILAISCSYYQAQNICSNAKLADFPFLPDRRLIRSCNKLQVTHLLLQTECGETRYKNNRSKVSKIFSSSPKFDQQISLNFASYLPKIELGICFLQAVFGEGWN